MPVYKNRRAMAPDTPLRRYMSLEAVVRTLRDQHLRLTRVDTFHRDDPFEGSVPQKQIDEQVPLLSSNYFFFNDGMNQGPKPTRVEDPWTTLTRRRRAKTRCAHVSCWSAGHESEAMWRLYCKDDGVPGQGVALESNLAMVETSVGAHDLFVSPVSYRYYHEGPAFYDELDAFMHKRMGFAHENEVRLLKYDEAQYLRLDEAATAAAVVEDLPVHIFLAWPAREAIESIVVSPYASRAYEKGVREQVASIATSLSARVTLSVLSEGRYESQF